MKFTLFVLLAAVLLVGASARGGRRELTKLQSDCLNHGGVTKNDISKLIEDLTDSNWIGLGSKPNFCILSCIIYDRIVPVLSTLGLNNYILPHMGLIAQCLPKPGPDVCESARGIVSCLTNQYVSSMMKQ